MFLKIVPHSVRQVIQLIYNVWENFTMENSVAGIYLLNCG